MNRCMGSLKLFGFLGSAALTVLRLALLFFVIQVCSLTSAGPDGFINIDCGLPATSNYTIGNNITYVSDSSFIDTGVTATINNNINENKKTVKRYLTVRSFPNGTRNCYTIDSISSNTKYLVRAVFMYGNYDNQNTPGIVFDLYLGVNLWQRMNYPLNAWAKLRAEAITLSTTDFIQVCLVNLNQGTPFINALQLRALNNRLYPQVTIDRSLVYKQRQNLGFSNAELVGYPDDPYDRVWSSLYNNGGVWQNISTNSTVRTPSVDEFDVPSAKVMQTALTTPSNLIKLDLLPAEIPSFSSNEYFAMFYFCELQSSSQTRKFYIKLNGKPIFNTTAPYSLQYLSSIYVYNIQPFTGLINYSFSIEASSDSDLPPLLNAFELYTTMSNNSDPGDVEDVLAMMKIKAWYKIKRNWAGDPCSPAQYSWNGLNCTYSSSSSSYASPRITDLNLSFSGLVGEITTSFGNLNAIQSLDLSNNSLTGTIPNILGELPSLRLLDLSNNRLQGSIPPALLAKAQNGSLILRTEGNNDLCATPCGSSWRKKIVIIAVVTTVVLLLAALAIYKLRCPLVRRHRNHELLQLENRQFKYSDLKKLTSNFARELGKGGFGKVYHGILEDGKEIAIKMLFQSSKNGTQDFLTEAQHLIRVHHKNLITLIGYCKETDHLALVYEYMSEGTLEQHLRGQAPSKRTLSWRERLQISIGAAQGLEYLHMGCKPNIVHRDVKTANILLSENLEAKLADFGLSKAFINDKSYENTKVMGTLGYVDPEYCATQQVSKKSDVYSFGVVLLELITGRPPIQEKDVHIKNLMQKTLATGNIEDVIDNTMLGKYDLNSILKCAKVAMQCTSITPQDRPTMMDVVNQLNECLELQISVDEKRMISRENSHTETRYISQISTNEIEETNLLKYD